MRHATGILTIGKVIWNRREWIVNPETKRRVPKMRPESEWIVSSPPCVLWNKGYGIWCKRGAVVSHISSGEKEI
jgi:hypothetical protein